MKTAVNRRRQSPGSGRTDLLFGIWIRASWQFGWCPCSNAFELSKLGDAGREARPAPRGARAPPEAWKRLGKERPFVLFASFC
jgi:hypothetical protein